MLRSESLIRFKKWSAIHPYSTRNVSSSDFYVGYNEQHSSKRINLLAFLGLKLGINRMNQLRIKS